MSDYNKLEYQVTIEADGKYECEGEFGTAFYLHEVWRRDGKRDRVGGPAERWFHPTTGMSLVEIYFQKGRCHRKDGPAYIEYAHLTGEVVLTLNYINNRQITKPTGYGTSSFKGPEGP